MDYFKFTILTIACIGGFMATSYSSLAQKKGWAIGSLFLNERISFIIVLGFICQFGSVIISFFVNPWWSAFIVFALGFVGYFVLSSILKVYSQFVSIILIVTSFILISLFAFDNSSTSENIDHFKKSIDFSNEGTIISNQSDTYETIDSNTIEKIIEFKRKALSEAKLVNIKTLNERLDGFGDHYKNEFVNGLDILIKGHETKDQNKFIEGQILLDKWNTWYSDNIDKIRKEI